MARLLPACLPKACILSMADAAHSSGGVVPIKPDTLLTYQTPFCAPMVLSCSCCGFWQVEVFQNNPYGDHAETEYLPHTDKAEDVAELTVGLSEKFTEYSEQTVKYQKKGEDISVPFLPVFVNPEDTRQQNSFKEHLIEL
jgi:hypothetical protein